jgi:hypothetical protein
MISAEALAFLRGPQTVTPRKAAPYFLSAFTTNADGETTATADAFLHVDGGTYNVMAKGVVIGQVSMAREDHGALQAATGLPVHDALDWARMPGLALMHVGAENAMAGKTFIVDHLHGGKTTTWLDKPPIAQVALADLSASDWPGKTAEDIRHDLGVFERAAEAVETPIKALERKVAAAHIARDYIFTAREVETFMWRTGFGEAEARAACVVATAAAISLGSMADLKGADDAQT